jgi:hypothetical protein
MRFPGPSPLPAVSVANRLGSIVLERISLYDVLRLLGIEVLSQHWKPERDDYGWTVDASPEQCVWIENGNEDIDTCPDSMIRGAARALGNPLLKHRSRVVLMFNDDDQDVARNCAWYVAQAFGAR